MAISENIKVTLHRESLITHFLQERSAFRLTNGDKVIDLTLENPQQEPPEEFNRELKILAEHPFPGMHRYMENAGYAYTRTAVAAYLTKETGKKFTQNEVIMTAGAAGAINLVCKALLAEGDEIIAFSPCFYEYEDYVNNHGGILKVVPTDQNFRPDLTALETGINSKIRAVIINSPNNPSGVVYDEATLNIIAAILDKKSVELKQRIYVISDDTLNKFYYGVGQCPRMINYYSHTVLIYSYSEELCLPGERIGYAAVNPNCENGAEIMSGLIFAGRVLGYVNAPALMQHAITNLQDYKVPVKEYMQKCDFFCDTLTKLGFTVIKPDGGLFILVKAPNNNDLAFAAELKKSYILVAPGSLFKIPGYVRISFGVANEVLDKALVGFRKAIGK